MADRYKLSRTAEKQIATIIGYSDDKFGARQTSAYVAGLHSSFELLVNFAGIGANAYEIKQGWRRYRYQSHYIFYSKQPDYIFIEAVIHVRQNIRRDLFDV